MNSEIIWIGTVVCNLIGAAVSMAALWGPETATYPSSKPARERRGNPEPRTVNSEPRP
jgi:hypothetical protein